MRLPNNVRWMRSFGRNLLLATLLSLAATPSIAAAQAGTASRVGQVYFSLDPAGKYPITSVTSGSMFYTRYEYFGVTAPNTLRHYGLLDGSSDRMVTSDPALNGPFTPTAPSGWMTKNNFVVYSAGGSLYTVVIELNGQTVAQRDILIK